MTAPEIQQRLVQSYDRARWLDTLRQILPRTEIFAHPQPVAVENARAESIMQLGKIPLAGGRNLALLEVIIDEETDLPNNRAALRHLVARYIDQAEYHGVFATFHQRSGRDFRFTFAAHEAAFNDSGQLIRTETAPRRYTYLLGPNESCRTAAERFSKLSDKAHSAIIDDIIEAFSVEKLNKEFFADFRKAFELVAKDILDRNPGWERADAERETQTLLSRLLFLYFIQRKGWLNRQRDYLISAFNRHYAKDRDGASFYDQFLRPFFVKLSAEDAYFPNLDLGDLPFLNGGLFDDEIGSLTERGRMKVGNSALRHVFDHLLEAYNFTVREDTPLDQEVAIDPEMLGKIFESLVLQLEQSDTGGKTSRHDTGSYYTPRPIVHYLCREGLRAWLEQFPPSLVAADVRRLTSKSGGDQGLVAPVSPINDWPSRLEKLFTLDAADGVDDNERAQLKELLTPDEARALLDRLDDFRACDPAVGSGAFLVGLLHELVNLRRLCESRSRGQDPAADIEWLYETKKRVIENVLYGVDIQQRAVEICKLRLWISLMVDYPLEVDPDNCALPDFRRALKKITPLPNLDFKIRRANSLIEQIRGHAIKFPQTAADSRDFALSLNRLATAKHRFYEARLKKEKRLAQLDALDATAELAKYEFNAAKLKYGLLPSDQDADRMVELAAAEAEMGKLQMRIAVARKKNEREKDDEIERLSRVFNDEARPTFVWQLDFAEIFHRSADSHVRENLLPDEERADKAVRAPSGFDLVLANPPYVRQEKIKELKPALQNAYDCYTGTSDLYVYFFECGVKLLNDGGVLSFISSNSFLNSGFGKKLRHFLKEKTGIRTLIDFAETEVFAAITEPCILIAAKGGDNKRRITILKWDESQKPENVNAVTKNYAGTIDQSDLNDDGWQLESPGVLRLLEKMRRAGKPLGEYVKGKFYRGIVTGSNEAFVVDRATRDRLIREDKSSAKVLRPFLRGRDVKRWKIESQDLWLIFVPWHFPLHEDSTITGASPKAEAELRKQYPAIYKHLSQFKKQLSARNAAETGIRYEWYALQRCAAEYWQEFEQPKIVYQDIARYFGMAWDDSGSILVNTCYFIPRAEKWMLGVLLSTAMQFYARKVIGSDEGGFIRLFSIHVEKFPISVATAAEQAELNGLVDRVLSAKRAGDEATVQQLEREIDAHVFRLFALTPEETKLIQAAQPAVSVPINVKSEKGSVPEK